jgi:DNA-binding GntR family transcriptional regulator
VATQRQPVRSEHDSRIDTPPNGVRTKASRARDTAYEAICDATVRGEIPPGAAVSNADVAQQLGLSRGPVHDELHGVLVGVCGNRALAATIERYPSLIRRLERRQRSSTRALRSVPRHHELIPACAAGDVDQAMPVTGQIWVSLEDLADDLSPL